MFLKISLCTLCLVCIGGCSIKAVDDGRMSNYRFLRGETVFLEKNNYKTVAKLVSFDVFVPKNYLFKMPDTLFVKENKKNKYYTTFLEIAAKGSVSDDSTYLNLALIIPPEIRPTYNYIRVDNIARMNADNYVGALSKKTPLLAELPKQHGYKYFNDTLFFSMKKANQTKFEFWISGMDLRLDTVFYKKYLRDTLRGLERKVWRAIYDGSQNHIEVLGRVTVENNQVGLRIYSLRDGADTRFFKQDCICIEARFPNKKWKPLPLFCSCEATKSWTNKYLIDSIQQQYKMDPVGKRKLSKNIHYYNWLGSILYRL